jgi:multiple sugar transport system permease protein
MSDIPAPIRKRRNDSDDVVAWLMSAPAVLLLTLFLIVPFVMAFVLSFTDYKLNSPLTPEFVGFDNYGRIFSDESINFLRALGNNLLFALVIVPLQTALALGMAMLVNRKLPGVNIFRTIYFIPVATVMVVVAVIWSLIYNSPEGLMNAFVKMVTFGAIQEVNWLDDSRTAFPAIMLLSIWQGAGYQMLIFLAGLQSIPLELYEAADMDGATPWQQFVKVTLPQLRNTLIFVIITTTILSFQLFDQNYVMTKGGPEDSTTTMVLKMVEQGKSLGWIGRASAMSVVFFLIVFGISLLQRKLLPEERAVN